ACFRNRKEKEGQAVQDREEASTAAGPTERAADQERKGGPVATQESGERPVVGYGAVAFGLWFAMELAAGPGRQQRTRAHAADDRRTAAAGVAGSRCRVSQLRVVASPGPSRLRDGHARGRQCALAPQVGLR